MKATSPCHCPKLPPDTWDAKSASHRVGTAERYAQIGADGWKLVLQSISEDVDTTNHKAIIIMGFMDRWGDLLEAFSQCRSGWQTSHFYICGVQNQQDMNWLSSAMQDVLVEQLAGKAFTIPGYKLPEQMPTDLVGDAPPLPSLNILVMIGDDKQLGCPTDFVKKWKSEPLVQARFREWLNVFEASYQVVAAAADEEAAANLGFNV